MSATLSTMLTLNSSEVAAEEHPGWRALLRDRQLDRVALALGLCAVPLSIVVAESFLSLALIARVVRVARGEARVILPRVFWFWLAWAGLEVLAWILAPEQRPGWSEIRHLLLIASLWFVLPALDSAGYRLVVWKGVFLSATLCSLFLIGEFIARLFYYRRELAVSADPNLYLRTGGLLNNWMVYGTVEIVVIAGFLGFWHFYPEERWRWLPAVTVNALAIVLSLTRMTWVTCLAMLGFLLAWRRSRWFWAIPLLPLAFYYLGPSVIRSRLNQSLDPNYFSNAERVQMLRVGSQMVRERPFLGVGPGRVGKLYRSYLRPGDPLPAFREHLHNNLAQLAAEFGLPVVAAALVFLAALFFDLRGAWRTAKKREEKSSALTALFALGGFLLAGLFDYTYGHSLALILLSFALFPPLFQRPRHPSVLPPGLDEPHQVV